MSGIWRQSSTQEGRQCAENQEQVHHLAHADQAVSTPGGLLFQDATHARRGARALYQPR